MANFPTYISCDSQENYNIELIQTLTDNLSDNGWIVPQITTPNLNLISSGMPDGTLWYLTDSTPPSPVMKINGIIIPLSSGSVATSVTGTTNQINVSPTTGAVVVSLANNAILPGTGGVTLPQGNTAARAGGSGTIRFNSQTGVFESTSDGINWATIETSAIGVVSVSGTAGRITCSPTIGSVVVDIDSTYVGQTSITTTGIITSGTWHASTVDVAYGGTGIATTTPYSVICAGTTATGAFQSLSSLGTLGQVLTSGGPSALPGWSSLVTGVSSVTGTANQIDVSPTAGACVVSLDSTHSSWASLETGFSNGCGGTPGGGCSGGCCCPLASSICSKRSFIDCATTPCSSSDISSPDSAIDRIASTNSCRIASSSSGFII